MFQKKEPAARRISVSEFVRLVDERLQTEVISESAVLDRHHLKSPRVQKLGLALSGFANRIHKGRIQIYGNSERFYLAKLRDHERDESFSRLDRENISCILITAGGEIHSRLSNFAFEYKIPLLRTGSSSSESISIISEVLSEALAPESSIHGVLLEVFGIGVLIIGESGIGKSECALDLITRGHRLISDDSVQIQRIGEKLRGRAPEGIRDFLEIRGLGIINARELFGVSALAASTDIGFCIEFTPISEMNTGDRLGLEPCKFSLLGTSVSKYPLPVTPGRNLATLVEAAVRVFVSRQDGLDAAKGLISKHDAALNNRTNY
jgi:HPr kinase/phosphorylase